MATFTAVHDGGETSEEGYSRLLAKLAGTQNQGIVGSSDMAVIQNGAGAMSVLIGTGDIVIPYLNYQFHSWNPTQYTQAIGASDPTYNRWSYIVTYENRASAINNQANNPGMLVFAEVAGTPSNAPVVPTPTQIQTAVGTGNPYVILSQINVRAGTTTILTSDITDLRPLYQLGGGVGGVQFAVIGGLYVSNNMTPNWVAPKNGTFTSLVARIQTAPVGQALTGRINKNGVQVISSTQLSIAAGANGVTVTGLSIPYLQGDYFSFDITQVGSTTAGSDLTVGMA